MQREDIGIVLGPSGNEFSASFASAFKEDSKTYLFYSCAQKKDFSVSSIKIAESQDGINFNENRTFLITGLSSVTPCVFKHKNRFYMVFASGTNGRRLMLASSDNLCDGWIVEKVLAEPRKFWEGHSIDNGTRAFKFEEESRKEMVNSFGRFSIYYSNVGRNWLACKLFGTRWFSRKLGILELDISTLGTVATKSALNPLAYLNGKRGSWNESLFCASQFDYGSKKFLVSAASNYSVNPSRQYIGISEDYGEWQILIEAPTNFALDTPCPLVIDDKLYLYYAVMNRKDQVWKTALSIFHLG